jgi:hypothetical protein
MPFFRYALAAAAAVALVLILPAPGAPGTPEVTGATADGPLRRGDILFKMLHDRAPVHARGIALAEKTIKALDSKFNTAAAKGNPESVHVALYLGRGRTAEAWGSNLRNARVSMYRLEDHAGSLFYAFRPVDAELADSAAAVAERWATGRMGYKLPLAVPFRLSTFGPSARKEALGFGRGAGRRGGPEGHSRMFCSQFAIAAYQAAIVAAQLRAEPDLESGDVRMPYGLQLHASHTSPLILHGRLTAAGEAKRGSEWRSAGRVLIKPAAP